MLIIGSSLVIGVSLMRGGNSKSSRIGIRESLRLKEVFVVEKERSKFRESKGVLGGG